MFEFNPNQFQFVQPPAGAAPHPAPQFMSGTLSPEQQQQAQQQNALVDALRNMGQQKQAAAPMQAGRVTSTGSMTSGIDAGAMGGALKAAFA